MKTLPDLTVTIIQPDLQWQAVNENLNRIEDFIQKITRRTNLILLPEMFNTAYISDPRLLAESMDGKTINWMKKQADKLNCVVAGSLAVIENGNFFNRLVWMLPDGRYSYYNKRHLFGMGGEDKFYSPGNQKLIVELLGWKICPLVCYDLRFPVWAKNTFKSLSYEYDLLFYVTSWPANRSYHFRQLLVARAIENQCYVAGVNRVGIDGNGSNHEGDSMLIDFKGRIMEAVPPDEEGLLTITLSYNQLNDFRKNFPVARDWDEFEIG